MADVSKIKLPDNTEVNIKDSRISSIDSTPTSGSTNPVTSGGVYDAFVKATPVNAYNYTSGYLVKTNLSTSANRSFYFRIEGKSHGSDNSAVFTFGSAYYSSGGFTFAQACNNGSPSFGPISLFVYNGYIYLWFSQEAAYYRFLVTVHEAGESNYVDTITDSAIPSSGVTHNISISPLNIVRVSGAQTISGTKTFSAGTLTVSTDTSGSPTLILRRGTASDGYVDHKINSSGGALQFIRSSSGTDTVQALITSTALRPAGTIVDDISDITLGAASYYWGGLYSSSADFKDDVTVGGNIDVSGDVSVDGSISASNMPTYYTGSSAPVSSLGKNGDIYLQISS